MKTVSPALLALLNAAVASGAAALITADLYTISLAHGGTLLYTTADFPITAPSTDIFSAPKIDGSGEIWFSGIAWQPFVLDTENTKSEAHWKVGLDTDSWTVEIAPRPFDPVTGEAFPDRIGSVPWLAGAHAGLLDNADVVISRCYFAAMPTWPLPPGGAVPVGSLIVFRGTMGEVDIITSSAVLTINDYKSLLSQQMPRNLEQSSCHHRLFDARCTLVAASFGKAGVVAAGSSRGKIVAGVAAPPGSATFTLGTLKMTSGSNQNFSRLVTQWDGASFALLNPFPFTVAEGDTFTVFAGCDKTLATCTKFANQLNFDGEDLIPVPELSIG